LAHTGTPLVAVLVFAIGYAVALHCGTARDDTLSLVVPLLDAVLRLDILQVSTIGLWRCALKIASVQPFTTIAQQVPALIATRPAASHNTDMADDGGDDVASISSSLSEAAAAIGVDVTGGAASAASATTDDVGVHANAASNGSATHHTRRGVVISNAECVCVCVCVCVCICPIARH
jgi:hypothetical protein